MTKTQIKCPQCGRLTFYSPENPYRPFCSDRCKLIDLGQWASGDYKIPTKPEEGYLADAETDNQYNPDADDYNEES